MPPTTECRLSTARAIKARRLAIALAAALIAGPLFCHVDDIDAQLYRVVARHIVESGNWTDLHYLRTVYPQFREHLPFGLWPAAFAIKQGGERAVNLTYGFFTLGTVLVVGGLARVLKGQWAAAGAILVLGTTESFWHYGARPLLEPPLLFFATLSAGMVLLERPRWILAALFGSIATLVKGPFGPLLMACAVLARAISEGSLKVFFKGTLATALAMVPLGIFLLIDHRFGEGTWWRGYLLNQLLASARGTRGDGVSDWLFPLRVVGNRFWPGLPLLAWGVLRARRPGPERTLVLTCFFTLALLCLPQRKWGNHTYLIFPMLGVLAGVASESGGRALFEGRRGNRLLWGFSAGVAVTWVAAFWGQARRILPIPCVISQEFAPSFKGLGPQTSFWLVTPSPDFLMLGELASEYRLDPVPVNQLPAPSSGAWAILRDEQAVAQSLGVWIEVQHSRGWRLVRGAR